LLQHVIHADDPPHRLALGCAVGIFVMFTPTLGIQSLLVVAIAWALRANKIIGLPVLWISNPATVAPIYGVCYLVGARILGLRQPAAEAWKQLETSATAVAAPPLKFWWNRIVDLAAPLWVGGIVVGLLASIPTYYLVLWGIQVHRKRNRAADRIPADGLVDLESNPCSWR
jgi:uncharacterized protein (DUF2062 family)